MSQCTIGERVLIVKDCRSGGIATGQTGIYEGRHPRPESGWENPRIRLQDGSVIWGCECWWTSVRSAGPLDQEQKLLEKHKAKLRAVIADPP